MTPEQTRRDQWEAEAEAVWAKTNGVKIPYGKSWWLDGYVTAREQTEADRRAMTREASIDYSRDPDGEMVLDIWLRKGGILTAAFNANGGIGWYARMGNTEMQGTASDPEALGKAVFQLLDAAMLADDAAMGGTDGSA